MTRRISADQCRNPYQSALLGGVLKTRLLSIEFLSRQLCGDNAEIGEPNQTCWPQLTGVVSQSNDIPEACAENGLCFRLGSSGLGRNYGLTRHTLGLAHKWRSKAGQRCRSVRDIYVLWLLLWPRAVE